MNVLTILMFNLFILLDNAYGEKLLGGLKYKKYDGVKNTEKSHIIEEIKQEPSGKIKNDTMEEIRVEIGPKFKPKQESSKMTKYQLKHRSFHVKFEKMIFNFRNSHRVYHKKDSAKNQIIITKKQFEDEIRRFFKF